VGVMHEHDTSLLLLCCVAAWGSQPRHTVHAALQERESERQAPSGGNGAQPLPPRPSRSAALVHQERNGVSVSVSWGHAEHLHRCQVAYSRQPLLRRPRGSQSTFLNYP
jgi:hypothetical protein